MRRRAKKALSLLLALATLCSLLIIPAAGAAWDGGTVTAVTENDGVYEVSTGAELAWIAAQVNSGNSFEGKTVRLTADIDLGDSMWTPIGQAIVTDEGDETSTGLQGITLTKGNAFAGVFDGDGHAISGLFAYSATGGVALFGYVTGAVRNLTVSGTVFGKHYTAGIVAIGQGTFTGITNQVEVHAVGNCCGGIMGDATGDVVFTDCHNEAAITNDNSSAVRSTGRVGGIIGRIEAGYNGTITNCSNTGDITAYQYVSGIIGGSFGNTTITGCYNTGHLTGISFGKVYVGGIAGKLEGGTVDSCYNWGDIDINCWYDGHTRFASGIVGSEEDHVVGTAITNCYNIGTINIDTSLKTLGRYFIYACGGISGGNNATGENTMSYENCFYLEGCIPSQDPTHESYPYWCDVFKNNPKAYDTDKILAKTTDELKGEEVLTALGSYFIENEGSYPILYWQDPNGVEVPAARSFAVAASVSGGSAAVSVEEAALEGDTVTFTISDIQSDKQLKSVSVIAASGAAVSHTVNSDGSYSFTMPSRAVTINVVLENVVAENAQSHQITLPQELDAIWSLTVDSTYYNDQTGAIQEGASVTVVVEKADGALTTSFDGITVNGGTVEVTAANEKTVSGAQYYGEYSFTMPSADVTVTLNATYSDLAVYVQQDGIYTLQKSLSRADMEQLAQSGYYSGWQSETEPFIGVAEQYITLEQVLDASGIDLESGDSISVETPDGFIQTYSYAELTAQRYYYSDILTNKTAASDKTPFGYALVLKGNMASTAEEINTVVCDTLNTYRFVYGQTEEELTSAKKCVDTMPKCVVSITVNKVAASVDTNWYNTSDTEFTIRTAGELRGLAAIVNGTADGIPLDSFSGKTVTLGNDIALAKDGLYTANADVRYGTSSYAITTTQYVLKEEATIWTPIGYSSSTVTSNTGADTTHAFAGTFDGAGYTVSGVYTGTKDAASANTDTVQGLFGVVTGTVKNVTVSGCITAKAVAGGIAAHLAGGTITNCVNNAIVFTDGGTTPNGGDENGIQRLGAVGGIVGNVMTGSAVTGCVNNAPVTCANSNLGGRAGGIIGLINDPTDEVTISGNGNNGFVDSYQYAGGIVGMNFSTAAPITECYNTGKVYAHSGGSAYAGGITSYSYSNITNCYNTGEVGVHQQGDSNNKCSHFAGIVSDFFGTAITNCYNVGQMSWSVVTATSVAPTSVGGICGSGYGANADESKLINCYVLTGTGYENITNPDGTSDYTTEKTAEEMKTADFVAALNAGATAETSAFAGDSAYINNGYPILTWQVTGGDPRADVWDGETIDIRWFDPDENVYDITYPAEFAGLAALVNGIYNEDIQYIYGDESYIIDKCTIGTTGGNNESTDDYHYGAYDFNGKTIYLCADIDMGTDNNYMPIGGQYLMTAEDTSTKLGSSFCGLLDGQGHNVTIYCDRYCSGNYGDGQSIGLIGRLGVHDNDPVSMYPTGAGVCNLAVYGYVKGNRSVGGVVGKIGKTNGGATIESCANFAAICGTDAKGTGGICGAAWNGGVIRNCYNAGTVTSTYTNAVAGIAGSCEIDVINCINVGTLIDAMTQTAAIGSQNGGSTYENCYWLTGTADVGVYGSTTAEVMEKSSDEMKSAAIVAALNGTDGDAWRADFTGDDAVNGGYPVLTWQGGRAVYTVTLPVSEEYTVSAAGGYDTSVAAGDFFRFTVTAAQGYQIDSVKAGETQLTCENDLYTITVVADVTVSVETSIVSGGIENPVDNNTNGVAVVTTPNGGWIAGENTFTVSADEACVVAVRNSAGNYTVLTAAAVEGAENTYAFTASLVQGDAIVVAVKCDLNGDGRITVSEVFQILQAANGLTELDALQRLCADLNGDGRIAAAEVLQVLKAVNGYGTLNWDVAGGN